MPSVQKFTFYHFEDLKLTTVKESSAKKLAKTLLLEVLRAG